MPDHEGVNCSRCQIAILGSFASVGDMIENPGDFGCGKVRIDDQSSLVGNFGLMRLESLTSIGRAAVLPDECRRDGSARFPFPYDRRFPLIGQSDRGDPVGFECPRLRGLP